MPKTTSPRISGWYLADLVVAITIERLGHTIVNVNTVLIHAQSRADACAKANERGRKEQMLSVRNQGGQRLSYRFLGLGELNEVEDALEHGAELRWVEYRPPSLAAAKAFVRPKRELAVFRPEGPPGRASPPGPRSRTTRRRRR